MRYIARLACLALALAIAAASAVAGEVFAPVPNPSEPVPGSFLWIDAAGSRSIALADVERLPMYRYVGRTGHGEDMTIFDGVLVSDLLSWIGTPDVPSIMVRARDGYSAEIPREDWTDRRLLFVTRGEAGPLTLRQRGPARIVYLVDLYPELDGTPALDRAVWLIVDITAGSGGAR